MSFTREQMRVYTAEYRRKRYADAITRFSGVCCKCGSTDGLQFDHKDKSTKSSKKYAISSMLTSSKKAFEAELAKCQLLCRKCHLEKSVECGDLGQNQHGNYSSYYRRKCRCAVCVAAWPAVYALHLARCRDYKARKRAGLI